MVPGAQPGEGKVRRGEVVNARLKTGNVPGDDVYLYGVQGPGGGGGPVVHLTRAGQLPPVEQPGGIVE